MENETVNKHPLTMTIKTYIIAGLLCATTVLSGKAQQPTPQWRPTYHFTPEKNWTNDPNGLIYMDGVYHLYYQHNPFENKWGHMSWGHATSTDLVNWKHLPVAIPEVIDQDTTWIFSGSAVLDKANTSGFAQAGATPLVAIYTADQPNLKKESQFVAYSLDGGATFKQYANNPVIDLNKKDFRDPNVFWHEPSKQWVMNVVLPAEKIMRIYGSSDLKTWEKLSDFGPAGYTKHYWECPFMVPLAVDGNEKNTKWVLMISSGGDRSSAFMQYFVGQFDGKNFTSDNPASQVLTVDNGDSFYAAIPWRMDEKGGSPIMLGWLQPGKPATDPWRGQMSIPRDLSLRTTPAGIRLVQQPSRIVTDKLSTHAKGGTSQIQNKKLMTDPMPLSGVGNQNRYWLDATFTLGKAKEVGFVVAQNKDKSRSVKVGYDAATNELFVDASTAEKANKNANNINQRVPLQLNGATLRLQVLFDGSSLEVFGNDGEQVITTMLFPGETETEAAVFGDGSTVKTLRVWAMDD